MVMLKKKGGGNGGGAHVFVCCVRVCVCACAGDKIWCCSRTKCKCSYHHVFKNFGVSCVCVVCLSVCLSVCISTHA